MPLAKDFFEIFDQLPQLNSNRWVLLGDIVCYLNEERGLPIGDAFPIDMDIEDLHSEVYEKLLGEIRENPQGFTKKKHLYFKTYTELIFLFSALINEIQDGPPSLFHKKMAEVVGPDDSIITFNWDTLFERALYDLNKWTPESGYGFRPTSIYKNDGWSGTKCWSKKSPTQIIKLHGSTNWLTGAVTVENGKLTTTQDRSTNSVNIFVSSQGMYPTYDGRWDRQRSDFSYGYYPPNLKENAKPLRKGYKAVRAFYRSPFHAPKGPAPSHGLTSMPLIIPPVKRKEYSFYGELFPSLWKIAEDNVIAADKIFVLGYSFPKTDVEALSLFKRAFVQRKKLPEIVIANPFPDRIVEIFSMELGVPLNKIAVRKEYLTKQSIPYEIINTKI